MRPEIPEELLRQAAEWDELHRWERRELGTALRRLGLMQSEIRRIIPVAKSTLSYWCRDVQLTPDQIEAIRRRGYSQPGGPRDIQAKRRQAIRAIRNDARQQALTLFSDPLFAAGVALYWAEGSKTRNDFALANTDPALLRLFISWVRCYLDIDVEFRLSLRLHNPCDEDFAKLYWQRALSLPNARFSKTYFKPPGTSHRSNRTVAGVCRVRVLRGGDHWQRTMAWIDYMGDCVA